MKTENTRNCTKCNSDAPIVHSFIATGSYRHYCSACLDSMWDIVAKNVSDDIHDLTT